MIDKYLVQGADVMSDTLIECMEITAAGLQTSTSAKGLSDLLPKAEIDKYLLKYDEVGNIKQIKMYDDYGQEIGWVDYTNHGYENAHSSHYHTMPHWHEKTYNEQYPDGIKINHRTDINTPLGDK